MGVVQVSCFKEILNTRKWNKCLFKILKKKSNSSEGSLLTKFRYILEDTIEELTFPPIIILGGIMLVGSFLYFHKK